MKRRRGPQDVEGGPSDVEDAAVLITAGEVGEHPAVDRVGDQQACHARHEQVERAAAVTRTDGEPDERHEQQQVHQRVRDRDHLLKRGEIRALRVRSDDVDPREDARADRDDERVGEAGFGAAAVPLTREEHDAGDETRIDGEIEDVLETGERERGSEQPFVVVGDDDAEEEEELPDREEVPR